MFLLSDSWVRAVLTVLSSRWAFRACVESAGPTAPSGTRDTHPVPGWQEVTPLHLALNKNCLTLFPAGVVGEMCAPRCHSLHRGAFMSLF